MEPTQDSVFDPFKRDDRYGDMGMQPQPWTENLRLLLLGVTLVPLKAAGALGCLLGYYAFCRLAVWLLPQQHRTDTVAAVGKVFCRACLFCIGFTTVHCEVAQPVDGQKALSENERYAAIVSNHCGWTDILVHMARYFPSFVARQGTQNLLWVGLISKLMGCIYVDRDKHSRGEGVAALVKARIEQAARCVLPGERPMLLFPEGTTTNGKYLLPFKTGAFLAGAPVLPVVLRYGSARVGVSWESIPASRHILLLLCAPFLSVTVTELPLYVPSLEEKADAALYARNVREYMRNHSDLELSSAVMDDKRNYHALLTKRLLLDKKIE